MALQANIQRRPCAKFWTCPCLFTEQGYEHATIQDIVDALGMSKGGHLPPLQVQGGYPGPDQRPLLRKPGWFSDPAKLPGRNGLEKLRHAFRHFLTDPAKREVDRP